MSGRWSQEEWEFIGSQMIRICRESPEFDLTLNYDKLTYSGDRKNCPFPDDESYKFVEGDICDEELLESLISTYDIDIIYNFAAESTSITPYIRLAFSLTQTSMELGRFLTASKR